MAELPEFLTDQTHEAILQRMLDGLPADFDRSEGNPIFDILSPVAIELALAAIWAQEVLRRGFAETTFGAYLDLRAEEHGVIRRAAVPAKGSVTFTGEAGTFIPTGTRISTVATTAVPAVFFETTQEATIPEPGTVNVPIQAVDAGKNGNVAAGSIQVLGEAIPGVTAVSNAEPTAGGLDTEDDASLLSRYLQKVRNPSTGGNKADYVNWALEVPGVGGVSVVPVRDGPGTVSVAIIDSDKKPASQSLVDAVQNYIAPPWRNEAEAETMAIGGPGVTVVEDAGASGGQAVQMIYDASGAGSLTHPNLHSILQKPGIWQVRVRARVDSNAGMDDLLQVGVWNLSIGSWAKVSPNGAEDAVLTLRAADLPTGYDELAALVEIYWNGQDQLELRVTRLQSDMSTMVLVDLVNYRSTFSRDTGEGKAPVGARVTVEPAIAVLINISAALVIAPGYNGESVRAAVIQNIETYIKSLAFAGDNDVRYVRIGQAILDTPGVADYSNLLVNGGTVNIAVGDQEVAVLGTVTLT